MGKARWCIKTECRQVWRSRRSGGLVSIGRGGRSWGGFPQTPDSARGWARGPTLQAAALRVKPRRGQPTGVAETASRANRAVHQQRAAHGGAKGGHQSGASQLVQARPLDQQLAGGRLVGGAAQRRGRAARCGQEPGGQRGGMGAVAGWAGKHSERALRGRAAAAAAGLRAVRVPGQRRMGRACGTAAQWAGQAALGGQPAPQQLASPHLVRSFLPGEPTAAATRDSPIALSTGLIRARVQTCGGTARARAGGISGKGAVQA